LASYSYHFVGQDHKVNTTSHLGVMPYFYMLGFEVVGYGCSTCVDNHRPLPKRIRNAVCQGNMVGAEKILKLLSYPLYYYNDYLLFTINVTFIANC